VLVSCLTMVYMALFYGVYYYIVEHKKSVKQHQSA
jgi:hypothetical protein